MPAIETHDCHDSSQLLFSVHHLFTVHLQNKIIPSYTSCAFVKREICAFVTFKCLVCKYFIITTTTITIATTIILDKSRGSFSSSKGGSTAFSPQMHNEKAMKPGNTDHKMQDTHQTIDLNINFKVAGDIRSER